MAEVEYKVARLRRTLVIIILATLPFYLLGFIVLWVARASVNSVTPTPTNYMIIITATNPPTSTALPPTKFPTKTNEPTATVTATFTATFTPTATSTRTSTETPTLQPTETATDVPPTETSTATTAITP